ncbi:YncE family protein [Paracoccus sp. p4-l81]|uniref:Vgb family protein n=2 Tax=unclassified Paracoccus (in: a-proteobacteria) TaxID=2688777 RepID=UPI0035B7F9D8
MIRALALMLMLSPASAGDIAFVTSQNAGVVSRVDLGSGAILSQTAIPGDPAAVAVTPDGGAFVVSASNATLHRLDAKGAEVGQVVLGGGPFGLAMNPARGVVYVADWYATRVWEIDADTLTIRREFAVGKSPSGIAVSPDGTWLAVADRDSDQVSLIDAETGAVRAVPVGARPFGVTIHDGRVFAANVGSDSVSVIDPVAGAVIGTVPVGERPYAVAFAAGRGFVTNQYAGSLTVFDAASLAVIDTIEVGEYPEGIDADSAGRVIVANWMSNQLIAVNATSLAIEGDWEMPDGPRAFGDFIRPAAP